MGRDGGFAWGWVGGMATLTAATILLSRRALGLQLGGLMRAIAPPFGRRAGAMAAGVALAFALAAPGNRPAGAGDRGVRWGSRSMAARCTLIAPDRLAEALRFARTRGEKARLPRQSDPSQKRVIDLPGAIRLGGGHEHDPSPHPSPAPTPSMASIWPCTNGYLSPAALQPRRWCSPTRPGSTGGCSMRSSRSSRPMRVYADRDLRTGMGNTGRRGRNRSMAAGGQASVARVSRTSGYQRGRHRHRGHSMGAHNPVARWACRSPQRPFKTVYWCCSNPVILAPDYYADPRRGSSPADKFPRQPDDPPGKRDFQPAREGDDGAVPQP